MLPHKWLQKQQYTADEDFLGKKWILELYNHTMVFILNNIHTNYLSPFLVIFIYNSKYNLIFYVQLIY